MLQSISAFNAKNHLGRLLDRAEAGEEMVITRHGKPVARLIPAAVRSGDSVRAALAGLAEIRRQLKTQGVKVSGREIRRWINEGRR